mmetsp:Transcript_15284/g.35424  ORF Transcript_15284/g.35424 Transcript_15284/m.35424 type:complete len:733 (+) Transcript_15284:107-2305(+)
MAHPITDSSIQTSNTRVDDVASGFINTEKLVSGDYGDGEEKQAVIRPVLYSDVALSFWGGIDELTGIVIDNSHPLCGSDVSDTILILPSGRGSCTASQVLLELILNRKAPRALVLRDRDGLICVGALVARCVLPHEPQSVPVLDVLQVDHDENKISQGDSFETTPFDALIEYRPNYGSVLPDGRLVVGKTIQEVEQKLELLMLPPENSTEEKLEAAESDFEFELSPDERSMLDETSTKAERRAVEVLIRYARIVTPPAALPTYIDVTRAHIDGCTYIGPGGLRFVERLVEDGGRVKIPTTLNSVSTDLRYWKRLGIEDDLTNRNSIRQADAYVALGCSSKSFTCAPYLLENEETIGIPQEGDQIVWGESNAVVFANTVLGARTEKYADYLDICCAIAGKVPQIGVHLDEPRTPNMVLVIDEDVLDLKPVGSNKDEDDSFSLLFPVLGHLCGSLSDGEVPLLVGLEDFAERITRDHLKAFCAAFGTTAASPLIHIAGVTPEAHLANIDQWKASATRLKRITARNLQETFDLLNQQTQQGEEDQHVNNDDNAHDKVDLIALGNPHLSLSEVDELLQLVENQVTLSNIENPKKREDVNVLACISRALYDKSPNVKKLEDFGFTFVRDTCWCMLLDPPMIPSDPNATILTNSGKYAHYGPGLTGRNFRLGSMKDCVRAAWTGSLSRSYTRHLPWKQIESRAFSSIIPYNTRLDTKGWNRATPRNLAFLKHALRLFK